MKLKIHIKNSKKIFLKTLVLFETMSVLRQIDQPMYIIRVYEIYVVYLIYTEITHKCMRRFYIFIILITYMCTQLLCTYPQCGVFGRFTINNIIIFYTYRTWVFIEQYTYVFLCVYSSERGADHRRRVQRREQ